ncbi:MAG: family N-acetyltransferase [Devosia sp.]|nr:family N-acetyltransferase [Devosia sp.]
MHWRALTTLDLPVVEAIAAQVHPALPEETAIFAERQRLYPDGARLFELDGKPAGYLLSHPWHLRAIPPLNGLLGAIPPDADTFHVHDLALLNPARGTGAAAMIVGEILRHARAKGFASISLVAVTGSAPFWHKHGFRVVAGPQLAAKLASYETGALYMSKTL